MPESALCVPATFTTSRKRKAVEEAQTQKRLRDKRAADKQFKAMEDEMAYSQWVDEQKDRAVRDRYSDEELTRKLAQLCIEMARHDDRVRRMSEKGKRDVAYLLLRKELAAEIQLPSFEEWQMSTEQTTLF